jgi:hypothetical protein
LRGTWQGAAAEAELAIAKSTQNIDQDFSQAEVSH